MAKNVKAAPAKNVKASKPKPAPIVAKSESEIRNAVDNLKAVASPVRLTILLALVGETRSVGSLVDIVASVTHTDPSQPNTSHHLKGLRLAGLVEDKRAGKFVNYSITEKGRALVKAIG